MSYKTEQEAFWAGQFGDEYRERCSLEPELVAARTACMARMLRKAAPVKSAFEIGCNIGLNLKALNRVSPQTELAAIEINEESTRQANALGMARVETASVLDYTPLRTYDLTLICGVLIHLDPEVLPQVYDVLFNASSRHILLFEYYNPTPVEVTYRGHEARLFKRDFAGEMLDRFKGKLELKDYGFFYHRDPLSWSDDGTWFLLEKG
ncbi:MAG: pseudaminic acid biosynthesis-associated methylase [Rhodobacterales bacterium CG15_BIG_FIL_POST_REV_8_21_14_020_59_13]|nr:MAG: pseudaminic acid biosynthesis-associated methylase [Rhodobacterales bacterium CG15_BIG_FIL_POST_REV_8_21_14_020_59_13]